MSVGVETRRKRGREARGGDQPPSALRRTGDWARRAPLLPALIFTIVLTQLPFVATLPFVAAPR